MGSASTSDAGTGGFSPFQASRGWFDHFKKHDGLCNVKLTGKYASAAHEAAKTFPSQLAQLIEEKWFLPEQMFNTDEMGPFWKKMPTQTFIAKHEDSRPQRTRYRFSSVQMQKGTV